MTAQRALSRRGRGGEMEQVVQVLKTTDPASAPARWHALWALDALDGGQSARADILAATEDPDASVRRQAIRQLGQRRVAQAMPTLLSNSTDRDASVRFQAATALGRVGETNSVPQLLSALAESDLVARFAVFTGLNRVGRTHPSAWRMIASGLPSEQPRLSEGAEFALRETYDKELVAALADRATDWSSDKAKATALRLLISLTHRPAEWMGEWGAYHPALAPPPAKTNIWEGTASALRAFETALGSPSPALRLLAIEGLQRADDRKAATAAFRRQFEREKEPEVRAALIRARSEFNDPALATDLADLLRPRDVDEAVFMAAIRAAGRLGNEQLTSALIRLVSEPWLSLPRRTTIIDVLGDLKAPGALSALQPSLLATDRSLRLAAQSAARKIGGEPALQMLRSLLANPSLEIRREAVAALGLMRERSAVPDLLAEWRAPETHQAALVALLGLSDLRALDAYIEALGSTDVSLRKQCRNALANIQNEALPLLEARSASLSPAVLSGLQLLYQTNNRARTSPLFANAKAPPAMEEYASYTLAHTGNAVLGQRVFFDETTVACIRCHAADRCAVSAQGPD